MQMECLTCTCINMQVIMVLHSHGTCIIMIIDDMLLNILNTSVHICTCAHAHNVL